MPQVTLEYSANVIEKSQISSVLQQIHMILSEMLPTDINTCKSRAYFCDNFEVGDGDPRRAFVHCTLKILSGRPSEIKQKVANQVLDLLKKLFSDSLQTLQLQITVELTELSPFYFKVASES